jgi:hypothetical protein
LKFLLQADKIHLYGFASGYDVHIYWRYHETKGSEYLPHAALEPVADDSATDLFASSDSQACMSKSIGLPDNKHPFSSVFVSSSRKSEKFNPLPQPD